MLYPQHIYPYTSKEKFLVHGANPDETDVSSGSTLFAIGAVAQ